MRTSVSVALLLFLAGCGSDGGASSGAPGTDGSSAQGNAGQSSGNTAGTSAGGVANASGGMGVGAGGGGSAASGAGNSNASGGVSSSAGASSAGASSAGASSGGTSGASSGGTGSGGTNTGTRPMKGVAFSTTYGTCPDLSRLGLSWYYNWGSTTKCTGPEYVPQIWGDWSKLSWVPTPAKAVAAGAKYLLGFNEPDGTRQANLSVADALALWPAFDQPGVKIGSPAVAGEGWLPDFMTGVATQKLRVDFIAVHWYGWNPGSCNDTTALEGKIKWAEQWARPIWITEWSCRLQAADVVNKFYSDALVMLKKHPLVERYAWFLTRSASDPNDHDFDASTLLDPMGNPSALGSEYIAAPSTR